MSHEKEFYALIVDTDTFTDVYDRQLVGWALQLSLPNDVFSTLAKEASVETNIEHNNSEVNEWISKNAILKVNYAAEISCADVWETPGYYNDGAGNIYDENTPEAMVQFQFEHTIQTNDKWPDQYKTMVLEEGPKKKSAYLSIAFKFTSPIPDYVVETIINRVKTFDSKDFGLPPVNVRGFRIVHRTFNDEYTDL